MSELYHAKKKKSNGEGDHPNPFSTNPSGISNLGNGISKISNKFKSTVDRMENSSGYQKVKTAQKYGSTNTSNKQSFTSSFGTSTAGFGANVRKSASKLSNSAKANKSYYDSKSTVDNEYNMMDNPPKKLRKKLNKTKLRDIIGPKDRKFYGEEGLDSAQSENKRAQQYRYTDWVAQPMPTSPGGTKHRRSKGG